MTTTSHASPSAESALGHDDAVDLLACQTRVLELMSTGAALSTMLDVITGRLEQLMPDSRCSLLLRDDAGALRHGSAPSLPAHYLAAIDGLVPGPAEGSCGTAAYLGESVMVPDITADVRWERYRAVAEPAGLRACWSTPVLGRAGSVVGTFAVYHADVHHPSTREQRIVERLTYLASVAVEHAAMIGAVVVSEERFRRAFEDSAVAMGLLDTSGVFTRANDAMHRLTGAAVVTGRTALADVVDPADRPDLARVLAEARAGRARGAQCEVRVRDGAGAERTVSLTTSLVRGASGEPLQVSVNMLDVTERLAAQRERRAREKAELARRSAEAASRAKSSFLSAVSHEMRTPLQAITGFAELLGTLELDPARRAEALRHITDGAAHLLDLVDDTLDLSRIEANALPLAMQPLPIAAVVSSVLDFLTPVARQHDVTLSAGPSTGVVQADERRLRQVLINLVSNGVRYGGVGAAVTVAAAPEGDSVHVTVVDDGPGIAADVRGRLFEPFVRSGSGAGLGLMLARGLTEAMGGQLTVDDADSGSGTVATLVLRSAR